MISEMKREGVGTAAPSITWLQLAEDRKKRKREEASQRSPRLKRRSLQVESKIVMEGVKNSVHQGFVERSQWYVEKHEWVSKNLQCPPDMAIRTGK